MVEMDVGVGAVLSQWVAADQKLEVLQWAHKSRLTCHSGIQRTWEALLLRFWWATLEEDTHEFVRAYPTCSQNKVPRQALAGLLQPLPVPHCPWSHISLDFITGLPPSGSNTGILSVVDRLSKMTHFVPLPKLPSAKETAQLMLLHVFRLYRIPVDIVSDRGPQFTSTFWKEFCSQLEATASLSLGFHPHSNGQTERLNQELETTCLVLQIPSSWSEQLLWVEYALSSSATHLSTFQCAYGYQLPLFRSQEREAACLSALAFIVYRPG